MLAIIVVLCFYVFLIFPIFIQVEALTNKSSKKIFFNVKLFNVLRFFCGYAFLVKEGVSLHISSKTAKIIPYKDIFSLRKKFKPVFDFHIVKAKIFLENSLDNPKNYILSGFLALIGSVVKKILNIKKPYVDFEFYISSVANKYDFNLYLTTTVVINFLTLIVSLINILGEKLVYVFRKG